MSWFSRKKENERDAGAASEVFSSPGMAIVAERLQRRPGSVVLELGAPSTESLAFLAKQSHDVEVVDLYHSAGPSGRTGALRGLLPAVATLPLPDGEARFDVILMWDLLHYIDPAERRAFGQRLAGLARPGSMVFTLASSSKEIPAAPIHFRIEAADRLRYNVVGTDKLPPPRLGARDVEQAMVSFSAERIFQLRNGFQEIILERNS